MEIYNITGMSCAACQTRIEKAVSMVDGVEDCAVNLLTNSMRVEGNTSPADIIKAVEEAGYGASLKNKHNDKTTLYSSDISNNNEIKSMRNRLVVSVILLIPLMYVSMGSMLWDVPLPLFLKDNHIAIGIYELLLAGLIMVINQKFFISGFKGAVHGTPNMDTLVALGSSVSYLYSIYALFAMTVAMGNNHIDQAMRYMDQFYFESAATILTLITVGKTLEARSKGKTTNALKALMELAPQTAVLLVDGKEQVVNIDTVKVGDKFVLRPGDSIPVDGIVVEGSSAINEAALTGESLPVEKNVNDRVFAATINLSGYMVCEATKVGEDTTLSEIIHMVSDASATKAPITKIADRVSGVFVPVVIIIAIVTFIIWLLAGQSVGYAIARAVSVLVISCPCALGLATPVAIMVGNGVGAKTGILFKTATSLEMAGRTQIIALDKTGTITSGIMNVTDVIPADGFTSDELVKYACSLENKSEHPISKAVVNYANDKGLKYLEVLDFCVHAGNGLEGTIDNEHVAGGNKEFISNIIGHSGSKETIDYQSEKLAKSGKTPIYFAKDNQLLGIIAVSDTVKEDSKQAINELKNMGIHVVMLTGDNKITAKAIASTVGVDNVVASLKPDGKEKVIKKLMEYGKVAMVGDGINDAPALTRANQGIAIGAGTDIATDAADIVLMKNSLLDVAAAIRISRATLKNIHENLFWAFFYNIIGIPLAAGCFVYLFGWTLNPMFGAAAMGLSSFCVVSNALRLNFVKIYNNSKDKKVKKPVNGVLLDEFINYDERSTVIMKISVKGMMCAHCEKHVKEALEEIDGIESAVASHDEGIVTITTSKPISEALLKATIKAADYEYCGIIEE